MKRLHDALAVAVVLLCTAFAVACASLGVPPADTFNKKLLAGYETVAWVAESARGLKLGDNDRANVIASNKAAIAALDLAHDMRLSACPAPAASAPPAPCTAPAADAKLTATILIINGLQAYLVSQGAKAP